MTGPGDKAPSKNMLYYIIAGIVGLVVGVLIMVLVHHLTGAGDDPVVAKFKGQSIRASEAFASVKTRLFDLEEEIYRLKERAVNDMVEQRLLEAEAKKQNLPVDKLIEKEMGAAVAAVSDEEVVTFLKSKGLDLDDPRIKKEDVREYLKFRKRHEKRQGYVDKLKAAANIKILLKEPESPKISVATEGYPAWGNKNAKVTIVEFSDFQCPFCSRAIPTLKRVKEEYGPDKVRIVFRDMPLPSHPRATAAAHAGFCAHEQGKFWEIHDKIFENQKALEDKDLEKYAKEVGVDMAKWSKCVKAKKYNDKIEATKREAQAVGISATPSFVINGSLLQGAQPFSKFKAKIDRELSK